MSGMTAEIYLRTYMRPARNGDRFTIEHAERVVMEAEAKGISPTMLTPVLHGQSLTIICRVEGFRAIAELTGQYGGQQVTEYCGNDGAWLDFWPDAAGPPVAAKVTVLKLNERGDPIPTTAVAHMRSFNTGRMNWGSMPEVMLSKVAESHALRKAFPACGGLYSDEEMDQAAEPAQPAPPKQTTAQPVAKGTGPGIDPVKTLGDDVAEKMLAWARLTFGIELPKLRELMRANHPETWEPHADPVRIDRAPSDWPESWREYITHACQTYEPAT